MDEDDIEILTTQCITSESLSEVRAISTDAAKTAGLDDDRADQFGLAVHESAANAVEHGGGTGELTVVRDDARAVIAAVTDRGPGMVVPEPIERPGPTAQRGRGLWLSQTLADRMDVASDSDGTVVHLEMELDSRDDDNLG